MDPEILEQAEPVKDLKVPESTIKELDKKNKEMEATIARLVEDSKVKDVFILTLSKGNIVHKLQYDEKITADELDFLKKNCTK